MTENIKKMLEFLKKGEYKEERRDCKISEADVGTIDGALKVFTELADAEQPVIFENDLFGFNRFTDFLPPVRQGNLTPNYKKVIDSGFDKTKQKIRESMIKTDDMHKKEYGEAMLNLLEVCEEIAEKYRACAKAAGNERLCNALGNVPQNGAKSLYEALVFMKLCIFCLRLYGVGHLTLGRFDQYMYSYYLNDKRNGVSDDEIFELVEAFFISINYDTDLYSGVQQGDNGQSMVLGGFDKYGNSMYNELSKMCMDASLELCLIDPKINLRVGENTPDEIFEYATLLTKKGLGFPQYCNDDVVVPGLIRLGYSPEDALDYTVAACWEYIVPGLGAEIPNRGVMDFPRIVNDVIREKLLLCDNFEALFEFVRRAVKEMCEEIAESCFEDVQTEMPLLSVFMDGCIETLTDLWKSGVKYSNYGCHGAGIANAADALAAVKKNIYEEKTIAASELLSALAADFDGYEEIRNILRSSPKMGNNDDFADDIASMLMEAFSENMNGRDNGHGGIWRAGTGSAMEYIWKGSKCPATADGRKAYEPYSSSFSPSPDVRPSGLLSVIQSFTKFDMTKIINGGPLTIEIHDSVLRNDMGIKKTAALVKEFICMGGHQLQLNAVNREILLDAQKNPEKYPNLIVRVWGWSGYFNELDKAYQDHIIRRVEYGI